MDFCSLAVSPLPHTLRAASTPLHWWWESGTQVVPMSEETEKTVPSVWVRRRPGRQVEFYTFITLSQLCVHTYVCAFVFVHVFNQLPIFLSLSPTKPHANMSSNAGVSQAEPRDCTLTVWVNQ